MQLEGDRRATSSCELKPPAEGGLWRETGGHGRLSRKREGRLGREAQGSCRARTCSGPSRRPATPLCQSSAGHSVMGRSPPRPSLAAACATALARALSSRDLICAPAPPGKRRGRIVSELKASRAESGSKRATSGTERTEGLFWVAWNGEDGGRGRADGRVLGKPVRARPRRAALPCCRRPLRSSPASRACRPAFSGTCPCRP